MKKPSQSAPMQKIKRFSRKVWRWFITPFRWITKPFHAVYHALSDEPEDTPLGETIARTIESPTVLIEHLEDLRKHLFRSLAGLAVGIAIGTAFGAQLLDWLTLPIGGREALQSIEVTETISVFMRISLIGGFSIALPYIGIEVYAFIHPGLKRSERRLFLITIPAASVLFLMGMAFAYYVMLPTALPFMLNFLDITTNVRPASYIRFVTGVMFWIGIAFQFPLVIYVLARFGLVKAQALLEGWRFAVVGIAVLAAAVTPTIDPVNMALVMSPMIVLYFLSIGLATIAQKSCSSSPDV
ncbi:MAG: twin-arginine translocase subunit TatC [Anaerolineales bacterium]|nr:twin-arginine translocase subunit TatC [Anaerolineales bacterium]